MADSKLRIANLEEWKGDEHHKDLGTIRTGVWDISACAHDRKWVFLEIHNIGQDRRDYIGVVVDVEEILKAVKGESD